MPKISSDFKTCSTKFKCTMEQFEEQWKNFYEVTRVWEQICKNDSACSQPECASHATTLALREAE